MLIELTKAETLMVLKTLRFFANKKTNDMKDRQAAERIHKEIIYQAETGMRGNSPLEFGNSL